MKHIASYKNYQLAVLFGLLFAIPIAPKARLVAFDLIAIYVCFFQVNWLVKRLEIRPFLWLFLFCQIALILSTIVNDTSLIGLERRLFSGFILFIESLAIFNLLYDLKKQQLMAALFGIMIGMSMHYFYPTDNRIAEMPIKFLLGIPLGVSLLVVISILPLPSTACRFFASCSSLAFAAYCFFVGSRSNGGIYFVAAVLVWIRCNFVTDIKYNKILFLYIAYSAVAILACSEIYSYLAIAGIFGDNAKGIAEFQSQFFGNILLGGRPELLVNLNAFIESPFIGNGPLSFNPDHLKFLGSIGVYDEETLAGNNEIYYHSVLFSAVHEGGLLPLVYWLYVCTTIFGAIPIIVKKYSCKSVPIVVILIAALWHILFSPLISYNRWILAIAIGLAFAAKEWRKSLVDAAIMH